MNELEDLRKECVVLCDRIEKLKQEQTLYPDWVLDGSTAYGITTDGEDIVSYQNTLKKPAYDLGLLFQTRNRAENTLTQIKRKVKVLARIKKLNNGWTPDFSSHMLSNCCFVYVNHTIQIYTYSTLQCQPKNHYFENEQIGKQILKEFGTTGINALVRGHRL